MKNVRVFLMILALLAGVAAVWSAEELPVARLKPVLSTATGLLLEPPVDLSGFTREEFAAVSATIGTNRINKKWTSAVVTLPPHGRPLAHGLTEPEIQDYMRQAKVLFDQGGAVPISDVGLVSTQEDVIRRPMYNHVSAFSNAVANVYLLVQKAAGDDGWSYFSIVQDRTVDPSISYFAELKGMDVKMEAVSCYKCHASGPLAIHPTREDLLNDPALLTAFNEHLIDQPKSLLHYPEHDPAPAYGQALTLRACARCHAEEEERGALFKAHSHSIRVLVDFGYMPPKRRLSSEDLAALKAWLEASP